MKFLKTSSTLFSLLATLLVSTFMVSCEQEIHINEKDVLPANPTEQLSVQLEEVQEIITSKKYSEDCSQTYYIPYNERLTNAEEARAYFQNLSEKEQATYLSNSIEEAITRGYCGPWELLECGFEPDCFFETCGTLPYRKVVAQDCTHGLFMEVYCWFDCN